MIYKLSEQKVTYEANISKVHSYKPWRFFLITFFITWSTWFTAAYLHNNAINEAVAGLLLLIGLLSPFTAALAMIFTSRNPCLRAEFRRKLTDLRLIKPVYLPFIILLFPCVMVLSALISIALGGPASQLSLTSEFKIVEGQMVLSLIIPILAPALEELGWSGYGIDAVRSRFKTLFCASVLFGCLWALWHLPLFFINGYYHHSILAGNPLYTVNFFISVVPLTVLTNWLYFKNGRSIIAAILFHVIVVLSSEAIDVLSSTKCIVTLVLTVICALIMLNEREFFFSRQKGSYV